MIKKGDGGLNVKKLQYRLGLLTDGSFGSNTEAKVKQWQGNNGLEADGIMHEKDWQKMFGCSLSDFTPVGIVVHSMSEYIYNDTEWVTAKDYLIEEGYSVHGLIKPNGVVQSMKLTNERAVHAGRSIHNSLSNLNDYFLGFEILLEGQNLYGNFLEKIKKPDAYSDYQFQSSILLTKVWMEEYNIPVKDVVRHSDVSGDDVRGTGKGKRDPGAGFDWDAFLDEIS